MTLRTLSPSLLAALLLLAACSPGGNGAVEKTTGKAAESPAEDGAASAADPYVEEIDSWRARRVEHLTADDGWLTLTGLFWLQPGLNSVGSAPDSDVELPTSTPLHLGTLRMEGEDGSATITFKAVPGVRVTHDGQPVDELEMVSDADGGSDPTVLRVGTVSFYVIRRGEKLGIRIKDSANPARKEFAGIDSYPIDPAWRLTARFEPYDPPKQIPIANILGMVEDTPSPGALAFDVGGKTYRLDALSEGDELFVIFADATSGKTTYGAGRFLYTDQPGGDGTVVVDFNKAYNPPCAFTPFATCPLPPKENKLPFAVEAGEKVYAHGAHS